MNIIERAQAPTPKIFRTLRNIGLVLAAASGVLLTSPVVLPAIVIAAASYAAVAGAVLTAVSQLTVQHDGTDKENAEVQDE